MKVIRGMSLKEFEAMANGCLMENFKDHRKMCNSESVGFCFLPETVTFHSVFTGKDESMSAIDIFFKSLFGIVSNDVIVEFEVLQSLTPSKGIYHAPCDSTYDFYTVVLPELCCTNYTRDTLKPLRYMRNYKWYPFY